MEGDQMILFVNDEKVITDMIKKALERYGYRMVAMIDPV